MKQVKVGWYLYARGEGHLAKIEGVGRDWIVARYVVLQALVYLEFKDHDALLWHLQQYAMR